MLPDWRREKEISIELFTDKHVPAAILNVETEGKKSLYTERKMC